MAIRSLCAAEVPKTEEPHSLDLPRSSVRLLYDYLKECGMTDDHRNPTSECRDLWSRIPVRFVDTIRIPPDRFASAAVVRDFSIDESKDDTLVNSGLIQVEMIDGEDYVTGEYGPEELDVIQCLAGRCDLRPGDLMLVAVSEDPRENVHRVVSTALKVS